MRCRRSSRSTSICGRAASSRCWISCVPFTRRPPPTATSAARTATSPGKPPTRPSRSNKQRTFHASDEQPPMFKLSGKVRRTKPSMLEHFKFLKSVVTKGTPKFTMPSPAMLHARSDRESLKKVYNDLDEFWADTTKAYREEIADLYKAGCRYLQID